MASLRYVIISYLCSRSSSSLVRMCLRSSAISYLNLSVFLSNLSFYSANVSPFSEYSKFWTFSKSKRLIRYFVRNPFLLERETWSKISSRSEFVFSFASQLGGISIVRIYPIADVKGDVLIKEEAIRYFELDSFNLTLLFGVINPVLKAEEDLLDKSNPVRKIESFYEGGAS